MKQILIFLILIFYIFPTDLNSQCTGGVGHVQGTIDSVHIHEGQWFIDTSYVRVKRLEYDAYEYSIYPADTDTTFYTCVRCDSLVAEGSSEIRRFIRGLGPLNPVIEGEKPVTWDYEGTMTVGNIDDFYGYDNGYNDIIGSMSPSFNYECQSAYWLMWNASATSLSLSAAIDEIEIGGVSFTNFNVSGCTSDKTVSSNPFPTTGNTVSIKIKLVTP
jgi:hypothetical protein